MMYGKTAVLTKSLTFVTSWILPMQFFRICFIFQYQTVPKENSTERCTDTTLSYDCKVSKMSIVSTCIINLTGSEKCHTSCQRPFIVRSVTFRQVITVHNLVSFWKSVQSGFTILRTRVNCFCAAIFCSYY